MSVSTPISNTSRFARGHVVALILAVVVAIGAGAWALTTNLGGSDTHPAQSARPTDASILRSLTPQSRKYVQGIMSMSPQQIQAAYGTVK